VGYLTEGSVWRQNDDGAGELRRAMCPELGDMSSAAPRRCYRTSSRGRALYQQKSLITDGWVDNRHRGVLIAARVRARWEEGGGLNGGLHLAQQSGARTRCRLKQGG
jgi:hypothetical protein